jgi:hypothetical protein
MADEVKVEDWYDIDENNYAHIHPYDLGLLIKQANGSYAILKDFNKVVKELRRLDKKLSEVEKERDRWAEWGFHVATCGHYGKETCWHCVAPPNQDQAEQNDSAYLIKRETKNYREADRD